MEVRILGAHQCETADRRFTSILIDGVLGIDAGGLVNALTLSEQCAVKDVLITHGHYDHIKDLASFGFNLFGAHLTARIHSSDAAYHAMVNYLLNPGYWLNFFNGPDPNHPTFTFNQVDPGSGFEVAPYAIQSVAVNHTVPSTGFEVTDPSGRSIFYTSDNGPGCGRHWANVAPDVLVTEVTYSNAESKLAERVQHLIPSQLEIELDTFRALRGYIPRVVVVHVNPFYELAITTEVADVATSMNVSIEVGWEGMTFTV